MAAGFLSSVPVALAGNTWTTVATAPGAGKQRQILAVTPHNKDSVQHTYEGRLFKGAVEYLYNSATVDPSQSGAPKSGELISNSLNLVATDEVFQVRYEGAATTTESECFVALFEVP